jgi:hypothetical protein
VNNQLEVKAVVVGDGARQRRYIVCSNREQAERQHQPRQELLAGLCQEIDRLDPQAPEHTKRACALVASKCYGR